MDSSILMKIDFEKDMTDLKKIMENSDDMPTKGWHTDFTNAPIGAYILLKSSSSESVMYRATLIKDKHGNIQRGICDTPWLDCEYGKEETLEKFVRDGIKAWYMPRNWMDYFDEAWKAVSLRVRPEITCSRKFPDGTVRAVLKNKMTGEREFIEWHEAV